MDPRRCRRRAGHVSAAGAAGDVGFGDGKAMHRVILANGDVLGRAAIGLIQLRVPALEVVVDGATLARTKVKHGELRAGDAPIGSSRCGNVVLRAAHGRARRDPMPRGRVRPCEFCSGHGSGCGRRCKG